MNARDYSLPIQTLRPLILAPAPKRVSTFWPSWETEHENRRRPAVLIDPEVRGASRHDGDVLLPRCRIRHDTATDRSACIEPVQHVSRPGIKHEEITSQLTGENE